MTVLVFDYTVLYHIFNHCVLHNSKIDEVHLLQVQWSPGDVQNCSRLGQGQLSCQEVRLFFLFLFFSSGSSLKFKVCGKSLRKLDFFSSLFFFFLRGWSLLCMMLNVVCIFCCFEVTIFRLSW